MFKNNVLFAGVLLLSGFSVSLSCTDRGFLFNGNSSTENSLPPYKQPPSYREAVRQNSPLADSQGTCGVSPDRSSGGRSPNNEELATIKLVPPVLVEECSRFFALCYSGESEEILKQIIAESIVAYKVRPAWPTELRAKIAMHGIVLGVLNSPSTKAFLIASQDSKKRPCLELMHDGVSVIFDSPKPGEKYYKRIFSVEQTVADLERTSVEINFGLELVNNPYGKNVSKLIIFTEPGEYCE